MSLARLHTRLKFNTFISIQTVHFYVFCHFWVFRGFRLSEFSFYTIEKLVFPRKLGNAGKLGKLGNWSRNKHTHKHTPSHILLTHKHALIHTSNAYTYIHTRTCKHTHIPTLPRTNTQTHTHTHTQTHTHTLNTYTHTESGVCKFVSTSESRILNSTRGYKTEKI